MKFTNNQKTGKLHILKITQHYAWMSGSNLLAIKNMYVMEIMKERNNQNNTKFSQTVPGRKILMYQITARQVRHPFGHLLGHE